MDLSNAAWRKSRYSGNNGGDCVEVAVVPGRDAGVPNKTGDDHVVLVRDSKNPDRTPHAFTIAEWDAFLTDAKKGRYDTATLPA